jgi:hypothetical protein
MNKWKVLSKQIKDKRLINLLEFNFKNALNLFLNFVFWVIKLFMINFMVKRKNTITKILLFKMYISKEDFPVYHNVRTMNKLKVYRDNKKNKKNYSQLIQELDLTLLT